MDKVALASIFLVFFLSLQPSTDKELSCIGAGSLWLCWGNPNSPRPINVGHTCVCHTNGTAESSVTTEYSVTPSVAENIPSEDESGQESVSRSAPLFVMFLVWVFWRTARYIRNEHIRYRSTSACCQGSFPQYLKYRIGHWYAWTSGSASIVLLYLSLCLLTFGGFLHYICHSDKSLSDGFWSSWVIIIAPDGGGSADTTLGRFIGMIMSVGGIIVFGFLMSVISSAFENALHSLREGRLPVVEGDHIVVLGYMSPLLYLLIEELCQARESSGGALIAIMTPHPKTDVEAFLQAANIQETKKNSIVVVRSGDMHKAEDLKKVATEFAQKVIILSNPAIPREHADTITLNSLVTLCHQGWPSQGSCIVQCELIRNLKFFERLISPKLPNSIVLSTADFIGGLMAQCSRQLGFADAVRSIFGFEGDEFYVEAVGGIAGKTFFEVLFALPGAIMVGLVASNGTLELLPPMQREFVGDEKLVLLAEDRSTLPKEVDFMTSQQSYPSRLKARSLSAQFEPAMHVVSPPAETIIIIGWNEIIANMIIHIDTEVGPNSRVIIHSPVEVSVREAFLNDSQQRHCYQYQHIAVQHIQGLLGARFLLEQLPLEKAGRIVVLADSTAHESDVDIHTLGVLVQLQDILEARCGKDDAHPIVLPQLLDVDYEEAVTRTGSTNYIMTNRLAARIIACVCEVPEVRDVMSCILERSHNFCIRSLSDYPAAEDLVLEDGVSFDEISAVVALSNEVALGWSSTASAGETGLWEMNPKSRQRKREWTIKDRLVVLEGGS